LRTPLLGIPLTLSAAPPPQQGAAPYLTHPVSAAHGADCPTCDLVEIPYNPNLPSINW
jgi:hypothetical protein